MTFMIIVLSLDYFRFPPECFQSAVLKMLSGCRISSTSSSTCNGIFATARVLALMYVGWQLSFIMINYHSTLYEISR